MGYHVGAKLANEKYVGARIGSYGSQNVWIALLFAAYGLSDYEEADRVRAWIEVDPSLHCDWSLSSGVRRGNKGSLKELLGRNDDDCTWVKLDESRVTAGFGAKPPKCDALADLGKLFMIYNDWQTWVEVPAPLVKRLAPIMFKLTQIIEESGNCWFETMAEVTSVFMEAAEHDAPVTYG
jgi:hypothetical protein